MSGRQPFRWGFWLVPAVILLVFLISAEKELSGFRRLSRPLEGVLDLAGWDYRQGRPSLAGEWEFYWDRLYTYEDFLSGGVDAGLMEYVSVPQPWNTYQREGRSLPGFGYATYRVRVTGADPSRPLSFRLDTMSTAYRLFVNDRELASNGQVGTGPDTSVPGCLPMTADFTPPGETFDIIVQVSNFTYARGGIWYEIALGTPGQIVSLNRIILYKDAILLGGLLIMALYFASFYVVLQRERSSKFFMLTCLVFVGRISLYGDMLLVRLFPGIPFRWLTVLVYATLYWIPTLILLLADSLYPIEARFNFRRAALLYSAAATLITAVLPIRVYTAVIYWLAVIGIGMLLFAVVITARAYFSGLKGAGLVLTAVFLIFLAGVHDLLYQANILLPIFGEWSSAATFFLMIVFSFSIARRLSDAYNKTQQLSRQLGEALEKEKAATGELIKTELSFLKAQIKPHFLYNSLSIIAALSTKDPPKTKALLYDFSDYLRGSFDFENFDGVTPLERELGTVRAYLSIEKERYQGRLRVEYDIDESISLSVPMLAIQPLVENAIRHGIMTKTGGGTVWLSVRREPGGTVISVRDDGVGISGERLAEIMSSPADKTGVGIRNIQRRLILHYGQGLDIQSEPGQGTTVAMRIPD